MVRFEGTVTGAPKGAFITLTFSLYEFEEGGTPLWSETQQVQLDEQGRYTALLGATAPAGLPLDLFTSGRARWLGVQPQLEGVGEQPRVLLMGMPYALKAADADSLGGKPASSFVTVEAQPAAPGGQRQSGRKVRRQLACRTECPHRSRQWHNQFPSTVAEQHHAGEFHVVPVRRERRRRQNECERHRHRHFVYRKWSGVDQRQCRHPGQSCPGRFCATRGEQHVPGQRHRSVLLRKRLRADERECPNSGGLAPGSYATTGANSFTGDQSIAGNLSVTPSSSGGSVNLTVGLTGTTATLSGALTAGGAVLPATGTATGSQGFNSNPLDAVASVFNTSPRPRPRMSCSAGRWSLWETTPLHLPAR